MADDSQLNHLKGYLFKEYGGFADKRIKKLEKSDLFIVDDRDPQHDVGADKRLYPWFCLMFAKVNTGQSVALKMWGGVPTSAAITKWIDAGNGKWTDAPPGIEVPVERGRESRLRDLAKLMQDIVKPGARYPEKSYKYVCPRTAKSLRRLADALKAAWAD